MTQRTLAGLLASALLVVLWVAAFSVPLPYVTYRPGPTVDVLAEEEGDEIVQVDGHRAYRDGGELRMTTVYVNSPEERVDLLQLMAAWLKQDEAVRPRDSVFPPGQTDEDKDLESSVAMVSSQDVAVATALRALDIDVSPVIEVLHVDKDAPAGGRLRVRDQILEIDGERIRNVQQVVDAVADTPKGAPVAFHVRRGTTTRTVEVTPRIVDGTPKVGIVPGPGYEFPFSVDVKIPETIGGPSAGLMFSLAIYDTLTPGSLTRDGVVAGTGTMSEDGSVGPIGGIQQKIAGAADAKSGLFLVPAGNCAEAAAAPEHDDMRLVRVSSFDEALRAVETWATDRDADLPTCEENE
jgi:Lon-like protease